MSQAVISAVNLGKQYDIGERERYLVLRDLLARALRAPGRVFGAKNGGHKKRREQIWALKDVSFEIGEGEVVGVIGRNGAGKSTLLKVLARVTRPTEGFGEIRGRMGSLLEVGTGFHPELTGRENVFFSGAILGMKKSEIERKFDEIVGFAEVERFIDTPLKHYSSGMQLRLAFSVAAHLEPEILLVDEVLAVGDMAFQKKCMGKMETVAKQGRTIVFVSHNMPAVTRLCQRGILLDGGKIVLDADAFKAASQYLNSDLGTSAERRWDDIQGAPGDEVARLTAVRVISQGRVTDTIDIREPLIIEMELHNFKDGAELFSNLGFIDEMGVILFNSPDWHERLWGSKPRPAGRYVARCSVPGNLLAEGQVRVAVEISTRHPFYETHVLEWDAVSFHVVDKGEPGSVRADWARNLPGVMRPNLPWENEYLGPV
jgi:lipopolysaccharide transport system ATP-binding protein